MVFNILIDNTDDHEKNHVLLLDDQLHLALAPAFDVVPTAQGLGYQLMRVGRDEADSTIENAMSEAPQFGLRAKEAREEAVKVARVVDGWKDHFRALGTPAHDLDRLAQFVDRDFLLSQRKELVGGNLRRSKAKP